MRSFTDIQQELNLKHWLSSPNGTLYYVPVRQEPRRPGPHPLVRRFDSDLPPSLISTYVDLHAAAQAWLEADPELADLARVEQPTEVGEDFIARSHVMGTHLEAYMAWPPEDDPPEPEEEMAPMQARFRARLPRDEREELLKTILARSLLEPTAKTMYIPAEERFVVADLKPTRDELLRWRELRSGEGQAERP